MNIDNALWFAVATQVVGFVVWIVRMEMRLSSLKERHMECQEQRVSKEDTVVTRLDKIEISTAEIKNDLKWLIGIVKNGKSMLNNNIDI